MEERAALLMEDRGESGIARLNAEATETTSRERLVVIGNGMASFKLCEHLTVPGEISRYDIVVLGEEPRPAYDRVHLTDFLAGRSEESLALGSRAWYAARGIALHTGRLVTAVARDTQTVYTNVGDAFSYDKLVFATGSRPFVPAIDGVDLPNVFVYRTIDDLVAIGERAQTSRSAAVIGGGLLGLEAARALQGFGLDCHVVEYAPYPLCAQLDPRAGELAQEKIESLGIQVHVNVRVLGITADGARRTIHFASNDDAPLTVDFVIVAAGIRPRHDLAESCGLTIAVPGGILVNDKLETSDPLIYAIGECASHHGTGYGLVAPAYRMAETLAENLLGRSRLFAGADLSTRLKVLGLDVAVLGEYNQPAASYSWESNGSYRRIVVRGNRLVGASALGEWPQAGEMQDAVREGRRVRHWQIQRFRRRGYLWAPRQRSVREWPPDATVCNCMNVSCGALLQARHNGCDTVHALAQTTGASTLCGTCKPLLAELVGDAAPVTATGSRGLGVAACAGLLLVLALFALPAIPYAPTVQMFPYDALWRYGVVKQITGFALAGVSLAGLLMSARKRISWFKRGEFAFWRALHGILGAGGLLILLAHTGMRFGSNLNAALMMVFVLSNLAGALTGGVVSSQRLTTGRHGSALRRWFLWGHIALVWPLPVLLAFHIVAAYYF